MYGGVTPPPSSLLLSLLLFSQSIFFGVCAIDNSSQSLARVRARPRPLSTLDSLSASASFSPSFIPNRWSKCSCCRCRDR